MPPKKKMMTTEEQDMADIMGGPMSYGSQPTKEAIAAEQARKAAIEAERKRKEEALKKALGEK